MSSSVRRKETDREYKRRNKEKINARKRERAKDQYLERKEIINTIKITAGCSRCGYNKCARSLHFHHLDPLEKYRSVGVMVMGSMATLEKEIKKCELLCANCHGEIT